MTPEVEEGIVTIHDILGQLARLDKRIEGYYASVRDESADNDARFCTYFLRRQQRNMLAKLTALELEGDAKDLVVDKSPDLSPERMFPSLLTSPATVTELGLLQSAVTYEEGLIELESNLSEQSPEQAIADFLSKLVDSSNRDITMLKKVIIMKSASRSGV